VWVFLTVSVHGGATTVRVYNYGIYPVTDVDVFINAIATCNYQNYCQPWFPYPCTNTNCGGTGICPGNTSAWTIAFNAGPCWNSGVMTLCNADTCPSGGYVTQDWGGGAGEIQLRDDTSANQLYKCYVSGNFDGQDGGCPGSGCCGGMPVWSVSEPFVSLWLHDEPLGYQPAIGARVSLELAYKQQEHSAGLNPNVFSFGKNWNFPWLSFVTQLGTNYMVHYPGGLETTLNGTNNYLNNSTLSGNTTNGFTILYPDGSQDIYGFVVTNTSGVFMDAYLTQRLTANSQTTTRRGRFQCRVRLQSKRLNKRTLNVTSYANGFCGVSEFY
jgi:hypothetical protein